MSIKKRMLFVVITAFTAVALLYSPIEGNVRVKLAERVLATRFQPYAWIFVGKSQIDQMQKEKIIAICGYLPDKNHPCE
jgi:hypothetical protein